jgi:hypothetical protein
MPAAASASQKDNVSFFMSFSFCLRLFASRRALPQVWKQHLTLSKRQKDRYRTKVLVRAIPFARTAADSSTNLGIYVPTGLFQTNLVSKIVLPLLCKANEISTELFGRPERSSVGYGLVLPRIFLGTERWRASSTKSSKAASLRAATLSPRNQPRTGTPLFSSFCNQFRPTLRAAATSIRM